MPTFTKHLNLRKPEENDFYNQETEQCENWDKLDEWSEGIDNKTKGATSEVAGIVKYGTDVSTALEGSKLAEILGIEYGGVLNNNNQKLAGKGYYDTSNKKIYKCTANTSINYADAAYFIEVSNNDLLGKLQNLDKIKANVPTSGILRKFDSKIMIVWTIADSILFINLYHAVSEPSVTLTDSSVFINMSQDFPGYKFKDSFEGYCGQAFGTAGIVVPFKLRVEGVDNTLKSKIGNFTIEGNKTYAQLIIPLIKI